MIRPRTRKILFSLFIVACVAVWTFIAIQLSPLFQSSSPLAETIETARLPIITANPNHYHPVEVAPSQQSPRAIKRSSSDLNILLLGFDLSEKNLAGRTDAILIARLKPRSGSVGIISVPRDLWVDIPGDLPGRINKVYRVGDRLHGRGGGHALLKEVIRNTLEIEIDYTISIDFSGFSAMVDLLGGIDVNVACPIRDNFRIPGRPGEFELFAAEAGVQHFSGKQALYYTRSRHGRSDLDRSARQQAVLMGVLKRLSDPEIWLKFPYLATQGSRYFATDLSTRKIISLAGRYRDIDRSRIHGLVLREPTVFQMKSDDGMSVLALNREKYLSDLEGLFHARPPGRPLRQVCIDEDAALHWRQKTASHKPHTAPGAGSKESIPDGLRTDNSI